ncbi:MAG: response regulator [bacterium]
MGKRAKIVLADDNPSSLGILVEALREESEILIAPGGKEALQLILSSSPPPDLILLDIDMPEMNGYEVCKALKSESKTCDIPVLFLTGMSNEDYETPCLKLGAVDYIRKPFNLETAVARIKTHLKIKQQIDSLRELLSHRTRELELSEEEYTRLFFRKDMP